MATTTTTDSIATFARRTRFLGWMKIAANVNEDTAIMIAGRTCPKGWVADTGAEWSDDFDCWVVPVYMPVR